MNKLEIKTTQQIVNRFSFDDAPKYEEWISKESLIELTKKDNLCYITKERLLKELECCPNNSSELRSKK